MSRRIWAPRPTMSRGPDPDLETEAAALVRLLREQGPLDARTLRRLAETRYWGPGVFAAALGHARQQGKIRRTGYRTYDVARQR
jgi:hypothetical protein